MIKGKVADGKRVIIIPAQVPHLIGFLVSPFYAPWRPLLRWVYEGLWALI
jgi:hypothetical protein